MLILTKKGLYCPRGDFYIDPKHAVSHAIITHAHSDHARKGSKHYYCTTSGVSLLKTRLGENITVTSIPYRETFYVNNIQISFHPAGHILGSSQVRLEADGEVWVVSGDYKREFDSTCERFEVVECDVFITEATFGTPSFRWEKNADVGEEIFEWWQENARQDITSVLYAYTLGKTQRILNLLYSHTDKSIYCTQEAIAINDCYRNENITLLPTICINNISAKTKLNKELLIVPPTFNKSNPDILADRRCRFAFASGWVDSNGYREGFTLSDHADWDDLLRTICETKAKRVYVQHRGHGALVKELNKLGIAAFPDTVLCVDQPEQLVLL